MEAGKFPFPLKLNNTFLNNQWIKKEIKWEIRKYLETTENKNSAKLWKVLKVVPREEFIIIITYIKNSKDLNSIS